MSIGGIGSAYSFWQQDQSFWQTSREDDNAIAATNAVINAINSAETDLGRGLASIANQTALNRVNSELTAAVQSALSGNSPSAAAGAKGTSPSTTPESSSTPATAIGTAPLTTGTPLSILGIPAGGSITVSAGGDTTTYTSTGSDTVGDLLTALNADYYGNAAVTAALNGKSELVLTAKDSTATITVGGVYASNIGFAVGHEVFKPVEAASSLGSSVSTNSASSSGASANSPSSPTKSSTGSSTGGSAGAGAQSYSTLLSENLASAASLLSDSGVGGTLVDMLA